MSMIHAPRKSKYVGIIPDLNAAPDIKDDPFFG